METTEKITKVKWGLDPAHTEIAFKVRHLMITNVKGVFREFDANVHTTGEDFMTAEIDFWLNPASIDTGDKKRDGHLKSADFFDVENHKQITFMGNTIEKVDNDGSYELYGDLTIKGIKKQVKLDVEFGGVMKDPWGNEKADAFFRALHDNGTTLLGGNAEVADQGGGGSFQVGLTDTDDIPNTSGTGGKLSTVVPDQAPADGHTAPLSSPGRRVCGAPRA